MLALSTAAFEGSRSIKGGWPPCGNSSAKILASQTVRTFSMTNRGLVMNVNWYTHGSSKQLRTKPIYRRLFLPLMCHFRPGHILGVQITKDKYGIRRDSTELLEIPVQDLETTSWIFQSGLQICIWPNFHIEERRIGLESRDCQLSLKFISTDDISISKLCNGNSCIWPTINNYAPVHVVQPMTEDHAPLSLRHEDKSLVCLHTWTPPQWKFLFLVKPEK